MQLLIERGWTLSGLWVKSKPKAFFYILTIMSSSSYSSNPDQGLCFNIVVCFYYWNPLIISAHRWGQEDDIPLLLLLLGTRRRRRWNDVKKIWGRAEIIPSHCPSWSLWMDLYIYRIVGSSFTGFGSFKKCIICIAPGRASKQPLRRIRVISG